MFSKNRVLSAFPDRQVGDYEYDIDWSPEEKALFVRSCGAEMAEWGYALDPVLPTE